MIRRLLCFLCLVSRTATEVSRRCYGCQDITKPSDCDVVTRCAQGYRCNARKRRGVPYYSSLSKRNGIVTCEECCHGDFCNNEGCGFTAPSQSLKGPVCFTCASENDPENCRHLQQCHVGEECMLRELPSDTLNGRTTYKSECVSRQVCDAYVLIGKRKRKTYCHVCCHDDYCNDRCDQLVTPAPTTPTIPSTTTTIPTTRTTTTKRPTTSTTTTTTTTPKPTTTHRMTPQELCHNHRGYNYDMHSHLCYKFHYEQKTWDQGNYICKHEGGTLAIIDTEAKWNYLRDRLRHDSHLRQQPQHVYIGGRDTNSNDDRYYWTNGERLTFTAWYHGQPDRGRDDCLYLNYLEDFAWNDYICNKYYAFICTVDIQ